MDADIIIRCPNCGTKNRIPTNMSAKQGICGRCGSKLPMSRSYANGPVKVSDNNFTSEVIDFAGPVLVEFTAPWWGHCRSQAPVLDELASRYAGKVKFTRVNVDNAPRTASQHNIRGVPAIYFYRNGTVTDKAVGALSKKELERRIESSLA